MPNKLKDTFSDKPFEINIKLGFDDQNNSTAFSKALEAVWSEGRSVRVDGQASIETKIQDGNHMYPFEAPVDKITNIVVAPSKETVEVPLEINNVQGRKMTLLRWRTRDKIILESLENTSIYFKIEFLVGTHKTNFTFKQQPNISKNIFDIVQEYDDFLKFLNNMFIKQDTINQDTEVSNDLTKINDMRKAMSATHSLYSKLLNIEDIMGIPFDPSKITHNDEFFEAISEIHSLIIEKKVVRMKNAIKDFANQEMSIVENDIDIKEGQKILLTFTNQIKYELLGEKIIVYTANALINAVVVDIIRENNIIKSVKYEGDENEPMFISFSGFLSEEDATIEQQKIIEKIKQYEQAKTVFEYIHDEL